QAVFDLNQLPDKVVVARFAMADEKDIQRAVATAQADPDGWRARSLSQRHSVLRRAAQAIGRARGDLMGAAAAETGKVFTQSDPEVSEAIDFTNYYPYSMRAFDNSAHLRVRGKGVGVVVSPWNFPIAIPCGGIAAALAAGNTVILKPASSAVLTAWLLCQCFWEAGVSRHTLQFLPCLGVAAGRQLIPHPGVDFVILTGGTETARSMLAQRSDLALSAETGGKNSTIVTAMADRDQAIAHVIASAFGHGGQKCSATSLLILEGEVYDDSYFKSALVDAAQSMAVGSAWRFHNRIGPLIRPPDGVLRRGLTTLAPGETWALAPRNLDNNPHLWTPGIKWGVRSGSFTHTTELFGPVLGVMRADHLDHAVRLANRTGYGLTAGLQSLDPREIDRWADTILAGNLYVNRGTTGAVVLRQPFGGWRRSAVGPAIKAGGPNYVSQFFQVTEIAPPPADKIPRAEPLLDLAQRWEQQCRWGQMASFRDDITRVACALRSYLHHARTLFDVAVDPFHLRGEANHLRHVPVGAVAICVHPNDTHFEVLARLAAAGIAGCRVWLSLPEGLTNGVTQFLDGVEGGLLLTQLKLERCRASEVTQWISRVDRLRYAAADRVPIEVFDAARQGGLHVASAPVLMDGRLELPHYYLNQTVTNAYHRSGNLGDRAGERLD
ncbi:MAG: aldehyde dehydrogenase family protein, partial [Desulfatitalea sp.]|nr:aldehyde dehydrogenase family protein [Desulfatitalea sp.]NNK01607.1 aldehyde dehydrogenase family protein [Desulfatitalea sp.]